MTDNTLQLVEYITSTGITPFPARRNACYGHIGATLVDTVLQSGLRYNTVVRPRADRIKYNYPEAITLTGFVQVVECLGAHEVLRWRHDEKPKRLMALNTFLIKEALETEAELALWLGCSINCQRLLSVRGVGEKSVDYLKILVGLDEVAVDRHLKNFLEASGVKLTKYKDIHGLISSAADYLSIDRSALDNAIWNFMAKTQRYGR